MSAQPYGVPNCWGRQFEENDHECDGCASRDGCKQSFFNSRGLGTVVAPPPPPPGGWQGNPAAYSRTPLPVIQPSQQYYSAPPVPQPPPQQQQPQQQTGGSQFWATQQAAYFEPHEGEGIGKRLAKNVALSAGANFCETMGSFFRTWRWP